MKSFLQRQVDTVALKRLEIGLAFVFCVFVFQAGFFLVTGVDIGFHLRTGAYVLETRSIPSTNTFSYTQPDHEWLLMQWWPAVVYFLVYKVWGVAGLTFAKAVIAAAIMLTIYFTARRDNDMPWVFWTMTASVMMARFRFLARPFMFSAFMFALLMLLDSRLRRRRLWQWLGLPLFMAVWANTHVGVLYGFVFLGSMILSEWISFGLKTVAGKRNSSIDPEMSESGRRDLWVRPVGLAISLLFSCEALELVNPNGCRVMLIPVIHAVSPFWQANIVEYLSPVFKEHPLFYSSLVMCVILQVVTVGKFVLSEFLVVLLFAILSLRSQRCILLYAIAVVPYAARMLTLLFQTRRLSLLICHAVLLPFAWVFLVTGIIAKDETYQYGTGFYRGYHPIGILNFMDNQVPPQNLFNDMRYGGSVMWWLYPGFKPFIDGRGTAYSVEFWQKTYLPAVDGTPEWREVFEEYAVGAALLWHPDRGAVGKLAQILFESPDWALVAYNDSTTLFVRRNEVNRLLIDAREHRFLWPGDWTFAGLRGDNIEAFRKEAFQALESSPECIHARTALARVALVSGDFNEAADLLEELVACAGEQADNYWRDYAYALYMAKRSEKADKILAAMIERGLCLPFAYYMRYFVARDKGDIARARSMLDSAIALEPDNADFQQARTDLDNIVNRRIE